MRPKRRRSIRGRDKIRRLSLTSVLDRCIVGDVKPSSKDAADVITFDLQQNLETPMLRHNEMFSQHQLQRYNFGVHDCLQITAA